MLVHIVIACTWYDACIAKDRLGKLLQDEEFFVILETTSGM